MNSIYPYPMDGDVVSYRNEEGKYVWGKIEVKNGEVYVCKEWKDRSLLRKADINYLDDLQWIKRKDGTPLVNVGDEISCGGHYSKLVLEVGVNSYMVDDPHRGIEWKLYNLTKLNSIKRKYPLPDEDSEEREYFTEVWNTYEKIMQLLCQCGKEHETDGRYKTVIPKSKSKEVTMGEIAEKFGVDVEDLKIKKNNK